MADLIISDIAATLATLADADLLEFEQGGVSKKGSADKIKAYILAQLGDTDAALTANSDLLFPTQKAVKSAIASAVTGLWDLKGSTNCSANPNYPSALKGDAYVVSVAGKIGGASGTSVDAGDVYIALLDNAGGNEATVGTNWFHLEHNLVSAIGTPAGSNKQVQFNDSSAFGGDPTLTFDKSTKVLSAKYANFGTGTTFNANAISGDDKHLLNITNDPSVDAGVGTAGNQLLRINSYGSTGYGGNVHFCRYFGSEASPLTITSGAYLMSIGYRGYNGSALSESAAAFQVLATENWTTGANGIKFHFEATPNGSAATSRVAVADLSTLGLTLLTGAFNEGPATTLASAGTTDLGSKASNSITVSGTTTITALGTTTAGITRRVIFSGALTLTHNATSLILPGAANITTSAGDCAVFESLGSGNWRCIAYMKANGQALVGGSFTGGTLTSALNEAPPVTIASASTVNIGAAAANTIDITGTTNITAFDTIAAGAIRCLRFAGVLTWTYNATSMLLPTSANITTAAGDVAFVISLGAGNWQCIAYQRKDGSALTGSGGGGGTKTYGVFTPMTSQPPATNYATLNTRNSIAVLEFDATTEEATFWTGVMPEAASLGSGLKARIHWAAASATSGDVKWGAALERGSTDLDADSFDTETTGTGTANGTSGIVTVTEISCTTIDSITAGDLFRLKIARKAADGADTMTGYAQIVAVELRSAA